MRERRSGHIFNISSVGGLKGVFGGSIYNASKFAVKGLTQAFAEEMAQFDVHVTAVAPGFFRTDFLDPSSATYTDQGIEDYKDSSRQLKSASSSTSCELGTARIGH